MSPLWGFGYLVCPVCYIHVAPLGLCWFVEMMRNVMREHRETQPAHDTHVAPLGLWLFGVSRVLYTCRPAGAMLVH